MERDEFDDLLNHIDCYCEYSNILAELGCLMDKVQDYFDEDSEKYKEFKKELKDRILEEL